MILIIKALAGGMIGFAAGEITDQLRLEPRLLFKVVLMILGVMAINLPARADTGNQSLLCGYNDWYNVAYPTQLEREMCDTLRQCNQSLNINELLGDLGMCFDIVQQLEDTQIELRRARLKIKRMRGRK